MLDGDFTPVTRRGTREQPHLRPRRVAAGILTVVSLPTLFACTGTDGAAGGRIVMVTSSDDSCDLSADTAPAGKVVYKVTNSGSTVTAFYVYDPKSGRIVGSVEDIGPGLSRDLVLDLPAGRYVRTCESSVVADGSSGDFTVTTSDARGTATEVNQQQIDTAKARYQAYVKRQATQLLAGTRDFVRAYLAGDDDEARRLYATTRMPLKRIEPAVDSFPRLEERVDDRAADVPQGQKWTGWHRIEKQLWPSAEQAGDPPSPAERARLGHQLLRDTRELCDRVGSLSLTEQQIADGATSLLEDVATDMVTGEEEVWSHQDLYDLQANVDGARAVFEALRPVLAVKDPALEQRISRRFTDVEALMSTHRAGGDGFVPYDALTVTQVRKLSDAVNALAEPLSMLTAAVAM